MSDYSLLITRYFMILTLDRQHSLAGKRNIEWFFANRKWIRSARLEIIECSYAIRPLPDGEAGIRFLLLAPKKSYKRAHDRNKIKRWLRAAITETEGFASIEERMIADGKQLLITIRISKQLSGVTWDRVKEDVEQVVEYLKKRVVQSDSTSRMM